MYLKLIRRGVLRHRRTGARLFALLALCSAAVIFFLGFRDSFSDRFAALVIDTATAHLQILPRTSPRLSEDGSCTDHRENLVLLRMTDELEGFLRSVPGVEGLMLAVETKATLFALDGEPTGTTTALVGVDPVALGRTLPGVRVLEGEGEITWPGGSADISVFRPPPEGTEVSADAGRFVRANFRPRDGRWEEFKGRVLLELPGLFPGESGPMTDERFLAAMTAALDRQDLAGLLPLRTRDRYDYRVDDALAQLGAPPEGAPPLSSVAGAAHQRVLRKRLLQSLYPDDITSVRDPVAIGVRYSLTVPPARDSGAISRPVVLPARLAAYVQRIPLFRPQYYVDANALRTRLGLDPRDGTNLYIRLASSGEMPAAKAAIEAWLAARGLDYVVRDAPELGKLFHSVSAAFSIISLVLVILFVATVAIFVVNTVLLEVSRRRREIGTSIAIGLTPGQNILIIFGEIVTLVALAWAAGVLIVSTLVLALGERGVPGMFLLPESRLVVTLGATHLTVSLLALLATSAVAAFIPLWHLAGAKPVDLLRESA